MFRPIQYLRALAALMVVWHHSLSHVLGVSNLIHAAEFGPVGVEPAAWRLADLDN